MNKKAFEFSFGWIFSMIAGAVIIFIAIYASTQFINTSRSGTDAQTTEQVGIILKQIETSSEDASGQIINFPDETRIYNDCRDIGNFGEQGLSSVARSDIGREWKSPSTEKVFYDKYLFSSGIVQGSDVNVFVKQFEMPYKTADFVYFYTGNYCFVEPPSEIEDEISSLNLKGINISSNVGGCLPGSVKVCFDGTGCDINVDLSRRIVAKGGSVLSYGGDNSLLYGAIFSDSSIYECQLRRAMKRAGELAQVYASKEELLSKEGCSTGFSANLREYAKNSVISSSSEIDRIVGMAQSLEEANNDLECQAF